MAAGPLGSAAAAAREAAAAEAAAAEAAEAAAAAAAAATDRKEDEDDRRRRTLPRMPTSLRLRRLRRPDTRKGPGWGIIAGFTAAFLATYPVHMYVAEVYVLGDSFAFLFVKYCLGFLFIVFVPLVILVLEGNIRSGVRSVFGSAVLCSLQDEEEEEEEEGEEEAAAAEEEEQEDRRRENLPI